MEPQAILGIAFGVVAMLILPIPIVLLASRDVKPVGTEKEYSKNTIANDIRPGIVYGIVLIILLISFIIFIIHTNISFFDTHKSGHLVFSLVCVTTSIIILLNVIVSNRPKVGLVFTRVGIYFDTNKSYLIRYESLKNCSIHLTFVALRTTVHYQTDVILSNNKKLNVTNGFSGIFKRYIGIELIRRLKENNITFSYYNMQNTSKHMDLKI